MSVSLVTLEKKSNSKTIKEKTPRINNASIDKDSMFRKNIQFGEKPSIHHKPVCPCGGGCPGCQRSIQAKLKISQPGDPYELEADRVSEKIMRKPISNITSNNKPKLQRKCSSCQVEDDDEIKISRKSTFVGGIEISNDFPSQMSDSRGHTLESSTRSFMESKFHHDFTDVRIHDDLKSKELSRLVEARAFTVGNEIFLGEGESDIDKKLIAHELTHVIQQQGNITRINRMVRTNRVSCSTPTPAIATITGPDPVTTITNADTRAIQILDNVIGELEFTQNRIRGGQPIAWPTISDAVALALTNRFRMDPDNFRVWFGRGVGTVDLLIKRYRAVRRLLNGGWIRYTCLAPATISTSTCAGSGCQGPTRGLACPPDYHIMLCRPWWTDSLDDKAGTLIHESMHIYFGFIGDTGHLGNAHCYDHFAFDLNGINISAIWAGSCP